MLKYLCKECFLDVEVRGFIAAQGHAGKCDCCNTEEAELLPIAEFYDFFTELLSNFQLKKSGESLVSKVQSNWLFFKNNDIGCIILNFVLSNIESDMHSAEDVVDFTDEIFENISYWQTLKDRLKWERRYINDIDFLTEDLGWDGFFNSKVVLDKKDVLYRARLHEISSSKPYLLNDMSCPPKEISNGGRANPAGIPFLYLSDNPETILYEIRASYLDEVSVGEFSLAKDIEEEVKISDFTEVPTLFHPSEVNKRIKSTLLKRSISEDLSKPMRRYDSELDYIPTQFICEFIKVFTGVHGIKFKSSLHPFGNNIVLFDKDIVSCTNVKMVTISAVSINSN